MRSALALARVGWLSATSYRVATLLQFVGVLATIVPVYFVSQAVQDVAAESIRNEGGAYFAFIVVGIASTYVIAAAASAASSAVASNLGNGTFESLLGTRASIVSIMVGLSTYTVAMGMLRALALLVGATFFGADIRWMALGAVLPVIVLTVAAYAGIGLVAAALVLAFRTAGPLISATIALSSLLGGAYYSTTVVPGWMRGLTDFVPLTYGLRATRGMLLGGEGLWATAPDVMQLGSMALILMTVGIVAFALALRHARRNGTLSQY